MSEINVVQKTQRIVVDPASSSIAVISAGPPGPAGPLDAASVTLLDGKVDEYTGTGSPNGVLTAPIGSQYVNTAATAGQVLVYIKTTNVGNTGWLAMYTIPS
jgi:hypothetical protein